MQYGFPAWNAHSPGTYRDLLCGTAAEEFGDVAGLATFPQSEETTDFSCDYYDFSDGAPAQWAPTERACRAAASAPCVQRSPWPGSTVRAPVSATASRELRATAVSWVAAAATICGPRRPV